jgi:hypothetical protein
MDFVMAHLKKPMQRFNDSHMGTNKYDIIRAVGFDIKLPIYKLNIKCHIMIGKMMRAQDNSVINILVSLLIDV